MARIRTVKPELWTDADFVECSRDARLLFVALLNFASDHGVLADRPKQLKMQCLPGDDIDIVPLLDELIARRFLTRTVAPDGMAVLVIRTFHQHQRVDKPQDGRWGNPDLWADSENVLRIVPERSENVPAVMEGNGREGKGSSSLPRNATRRPPKGRKEDDPVETALSIICEHKVEIHKPNIDPAKWRKTTIDSDRERIGPDLRSLIHAGMDAVAAAGTVMDDASKARIIARSLGIPVVERTVS